MSPADAIVVLGCRILPSGRPSGPARRRAAAAAAAFHEGVAPVVITSGGRRWGTHIEASMLRDELLRAGVPRGAIIEELWSLTTLENAIFSAAILQRIGAPRATLVTCSWHMARAVRNFRDAGVNVASMIPAASVPLGPLRRLWQRGHEIVCERLDARAMTRAQLLRDSADRWARAAEGKP